MSEPQTCYACRRTTPRRLIRETPQAGAGTIVAVLGLLLAPALIGIPLIWYGLRMRKEGTDWLVCEACGAKVPAPEPPPAAGAPERPFIDTRAGLAVLIILALVGVVAFALFG